jgi:hypothetical protein
MARQQPVFTGGKTDLLGYEPRMARILRLKRRVIRDHPECMNSADPGQLSHL